MPCLRKAGSGLGIHLYGGKETSERQVALSSNSEQFWLQNMAEVFQ